MIRAFESGSPVILLFIIDRNLTKYRKTSERRQGFFFQSVVRLERALSLAGASLLIREGEPSREIGKLLAEYKIETVFFNREDTPYGLARDKKIIDTCRDFGADVQNLRRRPLNPTGAGC